MASLQMSKATNKVPYDITRLVLLKTTPIAASLNAMALTDEATQITDITVF